VGEYRLHELQTKAIYQLMIEKGWQLRDVAEVLQIPMEVAREIARMFTGDPWKLA